MKILLIVVAFGVAVASPAFARSGNGHHQRFDWSRLNVHQQWAPSNLNNFEDRNYEGYPRSAN